MYFRNREYSDDSLFKTRLKKLVDDAGIKSARKLAEILFEKKMVDYKPIKEDDEEWKFRQDRIGAIAKKVQAHLNADSPKKVTGEYIEAYCKLFHCSPDYLFGRTVIKADDIEARRFCEITGLSETAVTRLMESEKTGASVQSGIWSGLLSSGLFYSIPEDYLTMRNELTTYYELSAVLSVEKWKRDHVVNKEEVDSWNSIEGLEEQMRSSRSSFYGMLSKVSRDIENYFEPKLKDGFHEYSDQLIRISIERLKRFFGEEGVQLRDDAKAQTRSDSSPEKSHYQK